MSKLVKTFEEAKRLSIIKWEWLYENSEEIPFDIDLFKTSDLLKECADRHEEIDELKDNCGFCEYFRPYFNSGCGRCPLNPEINRGRGNLGCLMHTHPYKMWSNVPTKENAKAVLDLIKNSTDPDE